jgi:hypothetical protein
VDVKKGKLLRQILLTTQTGEDKLKKEPKVVMKQPLAQRFWRHMLTYSHPYNPPGKRRWWIYGALLVFQFLLWSQSFATEIRWRKELKAKVDGQAVDCAFAGGMEFSKPTLVDIDADGDLDMFIGDKDGKIRFFRNEGTPQNPCWDFVSDFYDSTIGERSFPAFADIDDDGDLDLFVGNKEGRICFFRNDGNIGSPIWIQITDFYDSIDVGLESAPVFVDIDADLDLDLFVGKEEGTLSFYCNVGNEETPSWYLVSENYDYIEVGAHSTPAFVDIDADGDFDLFIGEEQGNINFYRNVGDEAVPQWDQVSTNYNSIDVGKRSAPVFVDMDDDSDLDLFVGQDEGKIFFYKNEGTIYLPSWTKVTQSYLFMDLGDNSNPALVDIDDDGDMDLFMGESEGNINFYQTEETIPIPSWSKVTENYFAIQADFSSPTFADIDGDCDLDLFIGRKDGKIDFYENIGTAESAFWNLIPGEYDFLDVGTHVSPTFVDIDGDADLDLFVGQTFGKIYFYRNDGTPQIPSWTQVLENFDLIDVGKYSVPTFGDLDSDGDFDLLVGNEEGKMAFYQNEGDSEAFSFDPITDSYDSIDVGERSTPVLCDFDSDGDLDLLLGESKGGLHYYKNLTLNSIRGKVTDQTAFPLENAEVYLSGDKEDTTFTDSSGDYEFVGLPLGNYCVFRDSASFQYCFSPLDSDTFEINFVGFTQVDEFSEQNTRKHLQLFPNYPNPFNPLTNITYFLPVDAEVKLTIYNLRGEKVKQFIDGFQAKGWKKIIWDGKNSQGKKVASGIYFCKLQISAGSETIRMVLLK